MAMIQNTHYPEYICSVVVAYGDMPSEAPSDRIREINGRNDDINAGFGGKFVWLVPGYSSSAAGAITGFDVFIQDKRDPTKEDLAKDTGGKYRYLVPYVDHRNTQKICSVSLLRSSEALTSNTQGYDGKTIDLNAGRGGDYLYIIWKSSRELAQNLLGEF